MSYGLRKDKRKYYPEYFSGLALSLLVIREFLVSVQHHDGLARIDLLAFLPGEGDDLACGGGGDFYFHFHGFQYRHHVALTHVVTFLHLQFPDAASHRGLYRGAFHILCAIVGVQILL